jgi:ABC-type polar amino acid transport system ATPase subunit
VISIEKLHKSFGDLEVLTGIDLQVAAHETVCVIGPAQPSAANSAIARTT